MIPLTPFRNTQPAEPRPPANADGHLDVVKIWPTIQGEGPFVGEPAVFIRLAGCNILCQGCDSDYTTGRFRTTPETILNEVENAFRIPDRRRIALVVITGGEPFRQDIQPLLRVMLEQEKYVVQIESNGTIGPFYNGEIFPWVNPCLKLVVSPKRPYVAKELLPHVFAYKYVLKYGEVDDKDGLPEGGVLGSLARVARPHAGFEGRVHVQPEWPADGCQETYKRNLQACLESSMKFGHVVGVQLHKYLEVE